MPDINAPIKYPPVGHCIYCSDNNPPLSDEHIVPYGLKGKLILPEASCRKCAHITGAIVERYCLQKMFGVIRYKSGFKSRHPKKRPNKFTFIANTGIADEKREEEYVYHPSVFTMPVFDYPTILCDLPPGDRFNANFYTMGKINDENITKIRARHPDAKKLTFAGELNMLFFARMLSKIAYSFAVAEYGYEHIKLPPLRSIILNGQSEFKFHHYIGGTFQIPPRANHTFDIRLERRPALLTGREFLVAIIRIFGNLGAPQYYVAVTPSSGLGEPRSVLAKPP
jgi:hypothetical protein